MEGEDGEDYFSIFLSMELIEPSADFSKSFAQALKEFEASGIRGFWNTGISFEDIDSYIRVVKQYSKGEGLPEGWVPSTTFWLIDNGEFVAHLNVRHSLNDYLRKVGGNIGYAVRPSRQKMGYGSKILELALPKVRELGILRPLVTCDESNVASRKIIEKNGGVLRDSVDVDGEKVLHYEIDLTDAK